MQSLTKVLGGQRARTRSKRRWAEADVVRMGTVKPSRKLPPCVKVARRACAPGGGHRGGAAASGCRPAAAHSLPENALPVERVLAVLLRLQLHPHKRSPKVAVTRMRRGW